MQPNSHRLRNLVILLAMPVMGWGLWRFLSVSEDTAPPRKESSGLVVDNMRSLIVRDSKGRTLWDISAKQVKVTADTMKTELVQMHKGVLYREGKPFLTISAPMVTLKNGSNDMVASGGVKAVGVSGLTISTASARWSQEKGTLFCDQPVKAQMNGLDLKIPKLKYEWSSTDLKSAGPVEVAGKGLKLTGRQLKASVSRRVVRLDGETVLTFDPNWLDPKVKAGIQAGGR